MGFNLLAQQSLLKPMHETWSHKIAWENFNFNGGGSKKSQENQKGLVYASSNKMGLSFFFFWLKIGVLYIFMRDNSWEFVLFGEIGDGIFVGFLVDMQIILKEDVADLGNKGQLMDVKAGFYRNYLLPLGKAQIVTPLLLK